MNGRSAVILGCGTSGGVPRVGNHWGVCDPTEPRNRRRRCSILIRNGERRVLIDTSPDLREQLLDADVGDLDGVIWTHDHADQCHGIDDVRAISLNRREPIPAFADRRTIDVLMARFGYCFRSGGGGLYPAILTVEDHHEQPFDLGGLRFEPIRQLHGGIISYGFRIGDFAYCNDVVEFEPAAFEKLRGIRTWIVDCMRYKPHPTHAHLERTLGWIADLKPERAILTNMHVDLDYATLRRELPPGVEPAYDGMVVAF